MGTFTAEVGRKFHADGLPRRFAGNTIVCMLDPAGAQYRLACRLQDRLRAQPFGRKFSLLPPDSLHMTVIELLLDEVRRPDKWSARLPLDAPLSATDRFFLQTVPRVPAPPAFRMRYQRVSCHRNIGIHLEPADAASAAAVRGYRDAVSAATGVRFPDHDTYQFHISLAYRLIELDQAEDAALARLFSESDADARSAFGLFEPGPPQLSFFDDMFRFVPAGERLALGSRRDEHDLL